MTDQYKSLSIEALPSHLILEILSSGRLNVVDLACLELTSRTFRASHGLDAQRFRSLVDFAAFQLCASHSVYTKIASSAQEELLNRCSGNWKKVLRFVQSVDQASDLVETPKGKKKVVAGECLTLLISDSSVYSCGTSMYGVLGHGPVETQCVTFTRINLPTSAPVVYVSASHDHAAFISQTGEVYTNGLSFYCGHKETGDQPIFEPQLVEALEGIPCKQVATGLNFTIFLTRQGHVYTCGSNTFGQLGHGDTMDRPTPTLVQVLEAYGPLVQVAAGPNYALALTEDGMVHSFGSDTNLCLGHGEQHNEHQPRVIQKFERNGVHVIRVSAGLDHTVALDSSGFVYTWGKGDLGALGHGDESEKSTPELLTSLKSHLAVQICAGQWNTFVLVDSGSVYAFGWSGYGGLGLANIRPYVKVIKPRLLSSLKSHHISQICTGSLHTVMVTNTGRILGFGDNERGQLGLDTLRGCPEPTETFLQERSDEHTICSFILL